MKSFAAVFFLLVAAPACAGNIDGKGARTLVKEQHALVLDVRTDEEFKAHHIEGAVNIPVDDLEQRLAELPDKKRTIIVYCKSGGRSSRAAQFLASAGYTQVKDLGGIGNW